MMAADHPQMEDLRGINELILIADLLCQLLHLVSRITCYDTVYQSAAEVIFCPMAQPPEETETETEAQTETISGVIVAGTGSTIGSPEASASNAQVSSSEPAASLAETSVEEPERSCPGHVDLIVNMNITGIAENRNLFTLDSIGEGDWPGWNEETMSYARTLAEKDWYETYGLSISTIAAWNPLEDSEINAYMAELPPNLSETRRSVIRFALESVGRVPYYWGGKPTASGYTGNNFGAQVAPDTKGRILKGLDCSGWISWVYWSATGERLPYESTAGLTAVGVPVSRSELQPGDIIIRTGTDAHVIMFLGWTSDGRIRCIHESSDNINNVTVSIRDANWPYYRKLVD